MPAVATMAAMHEEMHPDAEQQGQEQNPVAGEDMNAVLIAEQQTNYGQRDDQIHASAGFPERRWLRALTTRFVVFSINVVLHGLEYPFQIFAPRSRSELSTTEIEEALIAKAANMGLIKMPKNGNRRPAATGTPLAL